MTKLEIWVSKNYPAAQRQKFAQNKEDCLFFTGCFYSKFEIDEFGTVGGFVCPDCVANRGGEKDQGDQISEVGALPPNQQFERDCLCEEEGA